MKIETSILLIVSIILYVSSPLLAQSPYKITWENESYILGIGSTTGLTGFLIYRSVSPPTPVELNQLSRGSIGWFDRSATYNFSTTADRTSDILLGVASAAPFVLLTDRAMRDDWKIITLMYVETWSYIGATSMLTKGLVERFRPYVYSSDVPFDKKMHSDAKMSFYSNHTTAAFASAVFISTIYSDYNPNSGWKPYVWMGSLLSASVVGYLRYEAGMHFPTDILVGAVVGSALGYAIPWLHRMGQENVSLTPGAHGADYGFSVQVKL